jgi:hypothetical protein
MKTGESTMEVKNNSRHTIEVSVDQWSKEEREVAPIPIEPTDEYSWPRSDDRGYLMVVQKNGTQLPYFVKKDDKISVYDNRVINSNRKEFVSVGLR